MTGCAERPERGVWGGVVRRWRRDPKGVFGGIEWEGVLTLWLNRLLADLLETLFVER